jgi:hypothetical protein
MHYEVELRELTYEADGTGDIRVTGEVWRPVRVFRGDNITMPVVFGSLEKARGYADRNRAGQLRIVWVTEDGERQVVQAEGT